MSDLSSVECQFYIENVLSSCGHKTFVKCGQEIPSTSRECKAPCGANLACGHRCCKPCSSCASKGPGSSNKHGRCNTPCGRARSKCDHLCSATCHGDLPCPPCRLPCAVICSHSTCTKRCYEPCAPCAQPCTAGCSHQGYCKMPCAAPCDILPCSLRCEEDLACGHQCPSVCGESCPSTEFCQQCASTTVKQTFVDLGSLIAIGTLTYQDIDLDKTPIVVPACGHIILMTTMDRLMGMSDHYEISNSGVPVAFCLGSSPLEVHEVKNCPRCQGSLRHLHRYNRLVKRPILDESMKEFIVRSNKALVSLATRLQQEEKRLVETNSTMSAYTTVSKIRYVPTLVRLGGPRGVLLHNISELSGLDSQCGPLLALHDDILTFLGKVREDEQPFSEIQSTVSQRSQAISRATVLQATSCMLTKTLLLRCEYNILSEIIKMHRQQVTRMVAHHHWLTLQLRLDLDFSRRDCGLIINEAIQKVQPITEIEARLLYAKFVGLERTASADPDGIEGLLRQACRQIDIARSLWRTHVEKRHPQWFEKTKASVRFSASNMLGEIEEVQKMLHEGAVSVFVTNAERQAVYLAMTQELEGEGRWCYCANMHAVRTHV